MMRTIYFALVLAAAALGTTFAPHAYADPPTAAPTAKNLLAGTFVYADGKAGPAKVEQAIETVVSEANFIKRPFMRSRLRDANPLLSSVAFYVDGDRVVYTFNGKHVIESSAPGRFRWKSPTDGETYWVTHKLSDGQLVQTIAGDEGAKRETFKVSADGRT
ncbi:MAG: hypothetical protein MUF54_12225, partial [Polyangiaceae bacterium]|nr:hypothetical protein [Polyangiaceae bacterium]